MAELGREGDLLCLCLLRGFCFACGWACLLDGTHETGTEGQPGTGSLQLKQDPCGEKLSEQESSSTNGRNVELPGIELVAQPGIREHRPRGSPSHTARQILPHCAAQDNASGVKHQQTATKLSEAMRASRTTPCQGKSQMQPVEEMVLVFQNRSPVQLEQR